MLLMLYLNLIQIRLMALLPQQRRWQLVLRHQAPTPVGLSDWRTIRLLLIFELQGRLQMLVGIAHSEARDLQLSVDVYALVDLVQGLAVLLVELVLAEARPDVGVVVFVLDVGLIDGPVPALERPQPRIRYGLLELPHLQLVKLDFLLFLLEFDVEHLVLLIARDEPLIVPGRVLFELFLLLLLLFL